MNCSARETESAEIRYPAGVFSLTAVLQENNTWKIEPTSKSNATKLKRGGDGEPSLPVAAVAFAGELVRPWC